MAGDSIGSSADALVVCACGGVSMRFGRMDGGDLITAAKPGRPLSTQDPAPNKWSPSSLLCSALQVAVASCKLAHPGSVGSSPQPLPSLSWPSSGLYSQLALAVPSSPQTDLRMRQISHRRQAVLEQPPSSPSPPHRTHLTSRERRPSSVLQSHSLAVILTSPTPVLG